MADLKPCPFCGSTRVARGQVQVVCEECGCGTGAGQSTAIVVAWNRRAEPAPSPAVERVLAAASRVADVHLLGERDAGGDRERDERFALAALVMEVAALRASRKEPQGG